MNNNRNNNNRRRGRGNRQQGGGNQNRIDSRARGNAPQMLDKYKKLAQDAAHNGDRVQAEYYLQFADHYFRVIADNKSRLDEQRGPGRREDRDYQSDYEGEEDDFDAPRQQQGRQNERPYDRQNDRPNERSNERPNERSNERPRQRNRRDEEYRPRDESETTTDENEQVGEFEPAENPFVRPNRERGRGRGRDAESQDEGGRSRGRRAPRAADEESLSDNSGEIDAAALPPAFAPSDNAEPAESGKRKLPPRRRRPSADEADEGGDTLKAVG